MLHFVTIGRWLRRRARQGPKADPRPIAYDDLRAMPARELRAKLAGHPDEAARWIDAAARHGFPEAQLVLGQMLLDGTGVRQDSAAAQRWFRRAADAGSVEAMNMVGRCHELGWGIAADPAIAATWYRRAAERGLDWGQYNLANRLLRGSGVTRDRRAAFDWYRRAAAQGHAKSMNLLGRFLEEGWDMPRDPARALHWYQRSAVLGDFRGQYNFAAVLVTMGRLDDARHWFRTAIENGSADFLAAVGPELAGRADPELRELGLAALAQARRNTSRSAR